MTSAVEVSYHHRLSGVERIGKDMYANDPFTYEDGTTALALRSGVDGPYADKADRICSLNGRLYH